MDTNNERYTYTDYSADDVITTAQIKQLMKMVLDSGTSKWKSIIAGSKIIIVFIFFLILKNRKEHEQEMKKMQAHVGAIHQDKAEIEADDVG